MPQGSLSISRVLSTIAVQYKNSEYIFPKVVKDVPVVKDSAKYFIYSKNFRLEPTYRANKTAANMATWDVSTSTYHVDRHALKDSISPEDRANSDLPGSLDADTTEFLTDKIMMRQEKTVSDLLFTTTTFSSNATLNTATSWNYNTTTSAPIQNALSATAFVLAQSGKVPNTLITNFAVFAALKENNNIYNRLAYTKDQILTEQILASMFDVSNFLVGKAYYETQQEGLAATSTAIWPGDVLFAYQEGSPGIKKVTTANMFRVKSYGSPYRVRKWFDEEIEADFIEVETKCAPKVTSTLTAYLFKTAALI